MNGYDLTWVSRTPNTKTGDIPTAYVGATLEECRSSCSGCLLLDSTCYAWSGLARVSMGRLEKRRQATPANYTLDHALQDRNPKARAARIGAMGDPARASGDVVHRAVRRIHAEGLVVISYTHFWREPWAQHLKEVCMASCEDVDDADEALALGWTPTLLLPWDYAETHGIHVELPSGARGVVCPAQTRKGVTCDSCRMCALDHPVWKAGRVQFIGFLDHSKPALRERRRWQRGRQLPMFGTRPDVRPCRDATGSGA